MKPMYLRSVEEHKAAEPHATMFREMRGAGIPIPQILHLFAFKPERTQFLSLFTQGVMRGPSPLPPGSASSSRRSPRSSISASSELAPTPRSRRSCTGIAL